MLRGHQWARNIMRARFLPVTLLCASLPLAAQAGEIAGELALQRVMLSTGGVGYFEYAAEADGPAVLGLDVPLAQVDDVLASLVVFDSAGSVGGVDLPGHDQQTAAFAALPFGAAALHSPLEYLNSLQGVTLEVAGPRPMTGRLLRAESVAEPAPPNAAPGAVAHRTRVTLLTAAGLQQFVLEDADSVQVADPALRAAIAKALDAARAEPARAARHLTLRGGGAGKREVRVGYVVGAPLWKTTYRLVLPTGEGATARLQGWAVLENESGADWNGVDLTLQYGNPVTFRQALYRSYYVQRPEVPLEVLGRILPGVDQPARPMAAPAAPPAMESAALASGAVSAAAPRALAKAANMGVMAEPEQAVAAVEAAEATLFRLPSAVTLPAGHSATVPLLDRAVPAERVGVVQQGRAHPLQTLQFRNDTGASLPAGVLTLYDPTDAAAFAGDARLGGMANGETRLLEFAEDLRTAVDWQTSEATALLGVTASQGVLTVQQRDRWTAHIALSAPAGEARHLLLEIPRVADGALSIEGGLKATAQTAAVWRVPVTLKPGESRTVVAYVDRVLHEQTSLLDNDAVIATVIGSQLLSDAARAALRHVAELRVALTAKEHTSEQIRAQIEAVEADEDRLRKNLAAVAATDTLHGKLARALDTDEDRIAALNAKLATAEADATAARTALEQAVQTLKL